MTEPVQPPPTPLHGLRVLDLSRVLAGPWAAQVLGDLGADVIKVESPGHGDDTRHWGPPFLANADGTEGDAAYFTACNRNKRSVAIDFSTPAGADLVRELAARSDIVIENFKVGGLAKFGLDYAAIRALNPGIIYCSVTGFGQDGPYAHRAGYDFMIQGMAGLMSITGQPEGAPGSAPMKVGVAVSDLFTGMYAAVSILAAVNHRTAAGEGQHIDCALMDSQIAMLANQGANWLVGGFEAGRLGNNHPNVVPYRVYPTGDGHLIIACGNDRQFVKLCAALGLGEAETDRRFATNPGRLAHREVLDAMIEAALATWTRAQVIAALEAAGVPCGPINTLPEVFADPQFAARGLGVTLAREDGTAIPTVAYPARLAASPATYRTAPPALGADTRAVLAEMGLDSAAIERLKDAGAI